uniref:cytokinesis protein sepH-like isoform X2 n=1 Tax=Ciona intestinalis TaxID=7719 RepID=UPI00089DC6B2|nr:cytokinesis protein sepH-like isoform X2 [Ciona intestinalis]|eukprot:XP_018669718.1 cytokinesis protein sepH-like isoform X2 [Ciona intestinalis]
MHKIGEDQQIVHGDLKPSNIVLNDDFTAKVADFGGASLRTYTGSDDTPSRPADNVAHTPIYTAPERLANLFRPASKASDVYSYGMIIYECLSDLAPFENLASKEFDLRKRIKNNEIKLACERIEIKKKNCVVDQLDSLVCLEKWMKSCWQFNKKDRPAMKQVRDDLQKHFDRMAKDVLVNIAEVSSTIKYTAPNLAPSNERFPIDLLYPPEFRPFDVPKELLYKHSRQKEDQTREKSPEAQTNIDSGELKKTSSEKGEFAAASREDSKEDQKLDQPFWIKNSEITLQRDAQSVALLGSGTFGSVLLCHYERVGRCAVKCMPSSRNKELDNTEKFQGEAALILKADHPNIVRVFGITSWDGSFGIIMEYMERGNLSQLIQSEHFKNFQIPFDLLVRILLHVAKGVAYMHKIGEDQQIVHGDLKPSNIVLKNDFTAMVTDFGGATLRTCIQNNYTEQRIENQEHTVFYTAPERLKDLDSVATAASDVYSYGIIIYSCLSSFKHGVRSAGDLKWAIANCNAELPREAIEEKKQVCVGNQLNSLVCLEKLMEICWQFDEQHRPAMTHVRDNLQQHFDKVARKHVDKSIAEVSSKLKYDAPTPAPSSQSIPINLLLPPFFRPSDVKPESSKAFLEESSLKISNFEDNIMSLINLARKALESDTTRCESLIHSLNEELNKLKVKELCPDDCSRFVFEINALCEKINNPESPVFRQLAIHGSKLCLGIKNKAVQTGFHESFSEKLK